MTYQRFLDALMEARKAIPGCRYAKMSLNTVDAVVKDYFQSGLTGSPEHDAGCWMLLSASVPDGKAVFLDDKALLEDDVGELWDRCDKNP
jgi:hypothetical protein